jgi:membrane protease YdiL (CAAX protease family)
LLSGEGPPLHPAAAQLTTVRPPLFGESKYRRADIKVLGRNELTKTSGLLLIVLHLLPSLIFAGFFFILSRVFIQYGLTGYLALLILVPVCLVPIELGVMLFWSSRFSGRRAVMEAVVYRRQGTAAEYILLPSLLFICWGVLSIPMSPIYQYLESHLANYLPSWTTQEALIRGLIGVSQTQRSITLGLGVILSGFVAPIVEELYFRGFLLPRMEHWGWMAPVVNSLLFAIYHFYFPGNIPGIFLTWLPISYVVMRTKNWRIGAVVHSLINLWGVFSLTQLIT